MDREHDDHAEANRLYWRTAEPVARIAERLDLSRRGLYEALDPVAAGAACVRCAAELAYTTRSARKRGEAVCPDCGLEQHVESAANQRPRESTDGREQEQSLTVVRGGDRSPDARDADLRHRAVMLGGAAIACVALGTVATILARRQR